MVSAKITSWVRGARDNTWKLDSNLETIRGVVKRDGKFLCGLKKRLAKVLWPENDVKAAPRASNYGHAPEVGVEIEKQVETWCKKCRVEKGRYVKLAKDPRRKEARVVCGILVALDWTLVTSQAPVAYRHIGTRLDFVFQTPEGEQVLVELKTGHNYGLRKSQGKLLCFPSFTNNRFEHAYFQLTWTWAAIRRRGIKLEPFLMMVNRTAKNKFKTKATVRQIANQVKKNGYGRILTRLSQDHRKIANSLLETL